MGKSTSPKRRSKKSRQSERSNHVEQLTANQQARVLQSQLGPCRRFAGRGASAGDESLSPRIRYSFVLLIPSSSAARTLLPLAHSRARTAWLLSTCSSVRKVSSS